MTLRAALERLNEAPVRVLRTSAIYRSPAFPEGAGPDFANAAALVETALSAEELLSHLHVIEAEFGRKRLERWGPRVLDLDLVLSGNAILPDLEAYDHWAGLAPNLQQQVAPTQLILPHPRLAERAFVLIPLAEIAPDLRHPVLGLTVRQMLQRLPEADKAAVRRV